MNVIDMTDQKQAEYARFCGLKYHLRIEMAGMKHRYGALRPKLAEEFGLKPRAKYEDYITYCDKKLEELRNER